MSRLVTAVLIALLITVSAGAAVVYFDPFHPHATVTAVADGPGTVTGGGSYLTGTTVTLTAAADADGGFIGWEDGTTAAVREVAVEADATYTATFVYLAVVTAVSADSATGTVSGGTTVMPGTSVTVTATPAAGYDFISWSDGTATVSKEAAYTFTAQTSVSLTATFAIHPYTISVGRNLGAGGTVEGSGKYLYGEQATVTATVNEGYSFAGWYTGDRAVSSAAAYTFTVTGDLSLVAHYTVPHLSDFTFTSSAPTIAGGTETVTLTGTPGEGAIEVQSRTWVLSDGLLGSSITSTSSKTGFLYPISAPGEYKLTLTVKYNDGESATSIQTLTVSGTITNKYTWYFERPVEGVNLTDYSELSLTLDYETYAAYHRNYDHDTARDNALPFITKNDQTVKDLADSLDDLASGLGLSSQQKALMILRFVQAIPYVYDTSSVYRQGDYWAFPFQTLYDKGGDCEDFSFLCATLFELCGYDAGIVICDVSGGGHAMPLINVDEVSACPVSTDSNHPIYYKTVSVNGKTFYVCETTDTDSGATKTLTYGFGNSPWLKYVSNGQNGWVLSGTFDITNLYDV